MKTLTAKQQIRILKRAKKIYERGGYYGMCICIHKSFEILFPSKCKNKLYYPENIIPSFNRDDLTYLAVRYGFTPPFTSIGRLYFWDTRNRSIRLVVFDSIINELKLQL